jgi:tight adherence protein C
MTYPIFRGLLVALLVLTLGGSIIWLSLRPSRPTSRFGMRGLKRQRALLRPTWASVEPFIRWTGVRVSKLLDSKTRAQLDAQLMYAGDFLGMSADDYFAAILCSGVVGGALGFAISLFVTAVPGWCLVIVGFVVGGAVPYLIVDNARASRFTAISRGLPYAIDMMALSMSAGLDFPGSLQQVVEKSQANEALREELQYMLQQLTLGSTRMQVLRELATRAPLESVREFVQALIQAEDRGNPVASVLEVQATTARARRSNQAEKAAASMRGKMVIPAMMLMGVGMMLIAVPSSMMIQKFTEGAKK